MLQANKIEGTQFAVCDFVIGVASISTCLCRGGEVLMPAVKTVALLRWCESASLQLNEELLVYT